MDRYEIARALAYCGDCHVATHIDHLGAILLCTLHEAAEETLEATATLVNRAERATRLTSMVLAHPEDVDRLVALIEGQENAKD